MGIEHALLPEKGLVAPGEAVIGADSHTCTYGALGAFSTGVGLHGYGARPWPRARRGSRCPPPSAWCWRASYGPTSAARTLFCTLIGRIGVDGALYQSLEFCGDGIVEA